MPVYNEKMEIWSDVSIAGRRTSEPLGDTGSVWGGTGWYLVVLDQYNLVLFGMKWYSITCYCLV